ncbi:hypothetical protein [Rhodopila sp.]|uniref:hypothetical protein n=1 Tax=Rhodopila sp. TaxID=2480087 RepID=UPI003D0DDF53
MIGLTIQQRYRVKRFIKILADRANLHGEPREELLHLMLLWAASHTFEEFQKIKSAAADAAELHGWLCWQGQGERSNR